MAGARGGAGGVERRRTARSDSDAAPLRRADRLDDRTVRCGPWRACVVVSAGPGGAADDLGEGADEDHDVAPQRPVLDVLVVVAGAGVDGRVTSETVNLRPAGEPGGKAVPIVVAVDALAEPLHEEGPFRPGTDQRHVALDDAPQLRQLIERQSAQDSAYGGDAGVVLDGPAGVAVVAAPPRPALRRVDRVAGLAHAGLADQLRTRSVELHRE